MIRSTAQGALPASVQSAVEALMADLLARNQFIDLPVVGRPAGEVLLSLSGRACSKIGRRLAAVCDVFDGILSPARAAAYRRACELWAKLLLVLNRAATFEALPAGGGSRGGQCGGGGGGGGGGGRGGGS